MERPILRDAIVPLFGSGVVEEWNNSAKRSKHILNEHGMKRNRIQTPQISDALTG